jgi:hypothetical protein
MSQDAIPDRTERAAAACRRRLPREFVGGDLAFGFDGAIDRVRTMVADRDSDGERESMDSLATLRDRIEDSIDAKSSLNVEWTDRGTRTGGHSCHLARAFDRLGADPTMIGTYGRPPRDPFRAEFDDLTTVSVGEPAICDAVEFADGKLMLTEMGEIESLDWPTLRERAGEETLAGLLDGIRVLGVGYWALNGDLPGVVADLVNSVWPLLDDPPEAVLFDPADIRSLSGESLVRGARRLAAIDDVVPVTLSANQSEIRALAAALRGESGESFVDDAIGVYDALDVERVVAHNVDEAITLGETDRARVRVPRVENPELTTSAGDHFNVGLVVAYLSGLDAAPSLVVANAVAGAFVRSGSPPEYERIREFVETYVDRF